MTSAHLDRWRLDHEQRLLGSYTDQHGCTRDVSAHVGAAGSTLVIDRERAGGRDPRLVAHLAADEPDGNAALICRSYLRDAARGWRCRPLCREDAESAPCTNPWDVQGSTFASSSEVSLDEQGRAYTLELVAGNMSIPQLRWRRNQRSSAGAPQIVSLREAVAALQSYEPLRSLSFHALSAYEHDERISTTVLRAELRRVLESPIVLNRRLRDAVLATVAREELTMSEIALRCGRIKRDRRGNESGETSWLARRIGLLAESGHSLPTPWIHSDVLALVARRGLGISPREVEL